MKVLIPDYDIASPLLLQIDEEISKSIWSLKDKLLLIF